MTEHLTSDPSGAFFALDARFALWTEPAPPVPRRRRAGSLRVIPDFESRRLGNSRHLRVYLPPHYAATPEVHYPVLYMQDGQNLFDPETSFNGVDWAVDLTVERLAGIGAIRPPIVVGIDNVPQRIDEYTPTRDEARGLGGRGDAYASFVADEVVPFIERHYRTLPGRWNRGIAGSSMGALIALSTAERLPEVFGFCGALSPSLWWDQRRLLRDWTERRPRLDGVRLWFDIGSEEGSRLGDGTRLSVRNLRALAGCLEAHGFIPDFDFHCREIAGGRHDESSWGARFDRVLGAWLGR